MDRPKATANPAAGRPLSEADRKAFETARKLKLAVEALYRMTEQKCRAGMFGQIVLTFDFKDGYVSAFQVNDLTSVRDRPAAELPAVIDDAVVAELQAGRFRPPEI